MEFSNFVPPSAHRAGASHGPDRSEALAGAPSWARQFIAEYRRRTLARQSCADLRPANFGAPALRRESRSALVPFKDVLAADGSSLTKVPQHARDLVAKWTAEARAVTGERHRRRLTIALGL